MNVSRDVWQERRSGDNSSRERDYRSVFQRDYARIVHSASFRRLQSKTQILAQGDSDFYRTRLTHSLEVAQVGMGLSQYLQANTSDRGLAELLPSDALIQTICLAHDIGHPPFGHGGEIALNAMMKDFTGFEGNAHSLRIMSRLDNYTSGFGMDLSRRSLLGIVKYPVSYKTVCNFMTYPDSKEIDPRFMRSADFHPPKCYGDEEQEVMDWILEPLSEADRVLFQSFNKKEGKHGKSRYKSLDASIMELADDISYGVHDLEDAVTLRLIRREDFEAALKGSEAERLYSAAELNEIADGLFARMPYVRKEMVGDVVHRLIAACSVTVQDENFAEPLLRFEATMEEKELTLLQVLKTLVMERVILSAEVQTLEYKGQMMIAEVFKALSTDPMRLLPRYALYQYKEANGEDAKHRIICDYIAGMTDDYATRIYQRLFVPREGSVFDKI